MIKFKRYIFYISTILVATHSGICQSDAIFGNSISDQLLVKMKSGLNTQSYESIQGSPYSNDSFIIGTIRTVKGVFEGIPLRFDLYSQWMEFKEKCQTYIMDPTPSITQVHFGDESVYVYPYNDQGRFKLAYFYQLDSGQVKLLMKKTIKFNPKLPAKPMADETPAKFTPSKTLFYIKAVNQEAIEITNVKKLAELFPDHQKEVESFMTKKKTKLKEDDLIELWSYYNRLH